MHRRLWVFALQSACMYLCCSLSFHNTLNQPTFCHQPLKPLGCLFLACTVVSAIGTTLCLSTVNISPLTAIRSTARVMGLRRSSEIHQAHNNETRWVMGRKREHVTETRSVLSSCLLRVVGSASQCSLELSEEKWLDGLQANFFPCGMSGADRVWARE